MTRQAGQIKSAIAMWRPDKFQEMNKRLMGIDAATGTAQPLSRAKCLELVRLLSCPPSPRAVLMLEAHGLRSLLKSVTPLQTLHMR